MENVGTISMGIKCPIIREGDDLCNIVIDSIQKATPLEDGDVIGITESIVARAQGNYVTVDEVAEEIKNNYNNPEVIVVINPIYSRNRFSLILKAIARAAEKEVIIWMPLYDEVGNPRDVNPFTGVNIKEYYKQLVENEGKKCIIYNNKAYYDNTSIRDSKKHLMLYCGLHYYKEWKSLYKDTLSYATLADICKDKCPHYGLLGSNKANKETLKLFPNKYEAERLVYKIQQTIKTNFNTDVEVMIYGDGCFHSPMIEGKQGTSIWEFADPVVSPAYTKGLEGTPNEIKIKAFADDEFKILVGTELSNAIKNTIKNKHSELKGNMQSQGTTPRRYTDLLGSLMDLTSGSGDKGTPVVVVRNYFKNYAD